MKVTIRAKLVTSLDTMYSKYVFENLSEPENSIHHYITVTKCPNWQEVGNIHIGDIGYLEYETADAGEEYYQKSTNTKQQYQYTALYFMNFIKEKEDNKKEFKF